MNHGLPPAQGHDGWGVGPTAVLAEAVGLVERAIDGLRASGDVAWEARAAELYRAAVGEALQALVRDRELLDVTMRQAGACQVATFPHPDGPRPAGGTAVPSTDGGRPW
jgi:hypothetical protein